MYLEINTININFIKKKTLRFNQTKFYNVKFNSKFKTKSLLTFFFLLTVMSHHQSKTSSKRYDNIDLL